MNASRFSDAELAVIDQALMTVPFELRARVLATVAGTDQIAAQLSRKQEPEGARGIPQGDLHDR